jgi:2-polyprenyl-3-methyl-5-hydroxy-6-metoxy-1,4-benzoquinol methylase
MSESLAEYVQELNDAGGTYHRIDFGDGVVLTGQVCVAKHIDAYGIPERLDGLRVIDVGTATGYLAIECARRGADVTAIDVFDGLPAAELARLDGHAITFRRADLYDLPADLGTFDLVVCGSLLMHLPDPVGAIRALRSLCSGTLALSTAATADEGRAMWELIGANAGDHWAYWAASAPGLVKLCEVGGFSRVDHVARFDLEWEPPWDSPPVPHVVVRARV